MDRVVSALCVIFMILVSLENVTPLAPSGPLRSKKIQTMLILAIEANNETKIVKITHSAVGTQTDHSAVSNSPIVLTFLVSEIHKMPLKLSGFDYY